MAIMCDNREGHATTTWCWLEWEVQHGKRVVFWDNTGLFLLILCSSVWLTPLTMLEILQRVVCIYTYVNSLECTSCTQADSNKTDIWQQQLRFQEGDDGIKFLNIVLDREYRSTRAAWASEQLILQPTFAKSDKHFSTIDVIRSTGVAADRSGNERAVRVTKMSAYVKRGTQTHKNIEQLSDVWETWSYQSNFMFKSVL